MKRVFTYTRTQLERHPLHVILALVLCGLGAFLIANDSYFTWPPALRAVVNSDFFGTWAIFDGLGLLYVAFSNPWPYLANLIWLMSAAGFLGCETAMEIAHDVLGKADHTTGFLVLVFGYLILAFVIAKKDQQKLRLFLHGGYVLTFRKGGPEFFLFKKPVK